MVVGRDVGLPQVGYLLRVVVEGLIVVGGRLPDDSQRGICVQYPFFEMRSNV